MFSVENILHLSLDVPLCMCWSVANKFTCSYPCMSHCACVGLWQISLPGLILGCPTHTLPETLFSPPEKRTIPS